MGKGVRERGNSGEGGKRSSVGWQVRVEEMAEKEAVERRLQERRAVGEVRREVRGYLPMEVGGGGYGGGLWAGGGRRGGG